MENNNELKRINIKIPDYIQEFFKEQGKKYSMPYSNFIVFVLTQYYENEVEKKMAAELSETLKTLSSVTGNVTTEEMLTSMKDMMEQIGEMEKDD